MKQLLSDVCSFVDGRVSVAELNFCKLIIYCSLIYHQDWLLLTFIVVFVHL